MAVELPIVPATSPDHQVKSAQLADNESRLPTLERQLREISISTAKELKIATLRELTETKTKYEEEGKILWRRQVEELGLGSEKDVYYEDLVEKQKWKTQCDKAVEDEVQLVKAQKAGIVMALQSLYYDRLQLLANFGEDEGYDISEMINGSYSSAESKGLSTTPNEDDLRPELNDALSKIESQNSEIQRQQQIIKRQEATIKSLEAADQEDRDKSSSVNENLKKRLRKISAELGEERTANESRSKDVEDLNARVAEMKPLFKIGKAARIGQVERMKRYKLGENYIHVRGPLPPSVNAIHDRNEAVHRGNVFADMGLWKFGHLKAPDFQLVYGIQPGNFNPASKIMIEAANMHYDMVSSYWNTKFTPDTSEGKVVDGKFTVLHKEYLIDLQQCIAGSDEHSEATAKKIDNNTKLKKRMEQMKKPAAEIIHAHREREKNRL